MYQQKVGAKVAGSGSCFKCSGHYSDLLPEIEALNGVNELFRILSHDTRSKLLFILGRRQLSVQQMASLLDLSLPAVSHHLRILYEMRLVSKKRAGKEVFYSLRDRRLMTLIVAALFHAQELGMVTPFKLAPA